MRSQTLSSRTLELESEIYRGLRGGVLVVWIVNVLFLISVVRLLPGSGISALTQLQRRPSFTVPH